MDRNGRVVSMYEISHSDSTNKCTECGKLLGYLDPSIKQLRIYKGMTSIEANEFFSMTPHTKYGTRKKCFDCCHQQLGTISCAANVMASSVAGYLLGFDPEPLKKQKKVTLENMIAKHGSEEGKKKWESYVSFQSEKNTLDFKRKNGWSEEQFIAYNKSRAVTLENMIAKHGSEEGKKKWESYVSRQRYAGSCKDYFVELYGEEKGNAIWVELCAKKSNTQENFIARHGLIDGEEKWLEFLKSRAKNDLFYSSKSATEFFEQLHLRIVDIQHQFRWASSATGEHFVRDDKDFFFVDFCDPATKRVIEYFGDYWHMNPKLYDGSDVNRKMNVSAQEVWMRDARRISKLTSMGYVVKIIWEDDVKNHKETTMDECEAFIRQGEIQ